MKAIIAAALTATAVYVVASGSTASSPPVSSASAPAQPSAWQRLVDGNARYTAGTPQHPRQDAPRRTETAAGQKPFAVIVGCADSRTAPELLFDQGLGDLFTVRLAGNVVDDAALGSIEFAVASLGARLIVVLGHEKCGAVRAAVDAVEGAAPPPGRIGAIVDAIKPAAASVKGQPGDPVENALAAHVQRMVERLKTESPVLAPLLQSGEVKVMGARYDLDDGKVALLP